MILLQLRANFGKLHGTLTLHEEMGCGYWHGLSCSFDGALR